MTRPHSTPESDIPAKTNAGQPRSSSGYNAVRPPCPRLLANTLLALPSNTYRYLQSNRVAANRDWDPDGQLMHASRPLPLQLIPLCLWLVSSCAFGADIAIQVNVDPGSGRAPISPYIYGVDQDLPGVATPGSRRQGGNRMTAYNWETNASNAGSDYLYENDNFMVSGLPSNQQGIPAIAVTQFHDQSLAEGSPYTVLTVQMAGYVSADESGPVPTTQDAPSSRFFPVINDTPGGVFPSSPNLTDGKIYMDEFLNHIVQKYGSASGPTGVKGYDLDNEPDLWSSTHSEISPVQKTCGDFLTLSVGMAKTVKHMDPAADVLGPVSYGSEGYFTFQNAPDWTSIQAANPAYRWFLDYYLDQMSQASAAAGTRLLDVLDLHRYTDDSGGSPNESVSNQTDFSTNIGCDMERVQSPRVLWDPTFVEDSWVQQYFSQYLPWIPNIQASIAKYYPGTKLSFTEYNYGGESDISGGIAEADVLGIYGKYGVYLGCLWLLHGSPPPLYESAAFNLYLNYDGQGGKFGGTRISETDSDTVTSSAYASVDSANGIHIVALNKSYKATADVSFQIQGPVAYTTAQVYAFDSTSSTITQRASATISGNQFTYKLPPLTAAHFVVAAPLTAPAITLQPAPQTVASGSTVVLTAGAANAVSYQWEFNGSPLSDSPAGTTANAVTGSSGPQLVITNPTTASQGNYTFVATNGTGSTPSSQAAVSIVSTANPGFLVNISSRAFVGTGANILIGGFYIGGSTSRTVLIQAIGPGLASEGVSGVLQNTVLTIHDSSGATLYSNAGWGTNPVLLKAAAAAYANPVLQPDSADSEVLLTLPPGGYTAEVAGQGNSTGVALCAIYQLP